MSGPQGRNYKFLRIFKSTVSILEKLIPNEARAKRAPVRRGGGALGRELVLARRSVN